MDRLHSIFPKQNVNIYTIHENIWQHFSPFLTKLQPKLSTTAVLGTEESGLCREVAIVERFKQESMECLPKKGAVSGDLTA